MRANFLSRICQHYICYAEMTGAYLPWSDMGNIKDRDIALPSYKIMTLRDEESPLTRLKV